MLLAEELLLLALHPQGGTPVNSSRSALGVALAGTLVAELALLGAVTEDGRRLAPSGPPPAHPLLADVHQQLGMIRGRRAADQVKHLDKAIGGGWQRLVDPLADAGVLGRRRDRVLLVHVTHHPVLRLDLRDEVVGRLQAAATGDALLDPRTATVLAMSGPARLLEVVAPARADRRHARRRIAQATELAPLAAIVKKIIDEAAAAAAAGAAMVATTSATTS